MAEPDPSGGFDPDQFHADIRAAMRMGQPNPVGERPTFHFADHRTFDNVDDGDQPFDWTVDPTGGLDAKTPVQVLCAVEGVGTFGTQTIETAIGGFDQDRSRMYFFEDEWALVFDFTTVEIGGTTYRRVKRLPPLALFDVDIQVVEVKAFDES